jgi:hypothetical protein
MGGLKPTAKAKLLTLDRIDGRTLAAKSVREMMSAIQSDLGGIEQLSTAELQIVQRAAVTGAILESMETEWLSGGPIDAPTYVALGNAQRRYLESVGIKRVPKPVQSLQEYLARKERT